MGCKGNICVGSSVLKENQEAMAKLDRPLKDVAVEFLTECYQIMKR